jgi:2-desacetyl-2-hydroxyethyl bacteriochlorophyllide A dehydrogenase
MKALVVDVNGKLTVEEVPVPKYNENQALVKTVACGICGGTDGKLIHGKFKGVRASKYPLMLGHEGVGKVVEVGSNVKSLKVGDYVMIPFIDPDKENYGNLGTAWGAFAEYAVVNDMTAYEEKVPPVAYAQTIVPKDIDPVDAAMIVTLREVLCAIHSFGIKEDSSVAVFGSGPVGLTFIKLMRLVGVKEIIAIVRSEDKAKAALDSGAHYTINSRECENLREEVRKICPRGVKFVLDAVGAHEIINQGLTLISNRGKICCYGIAPESVMNLDWTNAPYNWNIQFEQFPDKREEGAVNDQIIAWIREGKLNLKDHISDYSAFENILEALEKLEKKELKKKGIVVY